MRACKSKPVHDGDIMPIGIQQPVEDTKAAEIGDPTRDNSSNEMFQVVLKKLDQPGTRLSHLEGRSGKQHRDQDHDQRGQGPARSAKKGAVISYHCRQQEHYARVCTNKSSGSGDHLTLHALDGGSEGEPSRVPRFLPTSSVPVCLTYSVEGTINQVPVSFVIDMAMAVGLV